MTYLRSVFDKMVKDPEMIAIADKRKLTLNPTTGTEVDKIVQDILKAPKELVEKAECRPVRAVGVVGDQHQFEAVGGVVERQGGDHGPHEG